MKRTLGLLALVAAVIVVPSVASAQGTFVGVKACTMCHKSEKQGQQLAIWEKSKHAGAYTTLTTAKANDIAKAKGLAKPAAESPECLACHAAPAPEGASRAARTSSVADGVTCEACHAPGSAYSPEAIMRDPAAARRAGLVSAPGATCAGCHEKAHGKPFDQAAAMAAIAHPSKPPSTPPSAQGPQSAVFCPQPRMQADTLETSK